MTYKEAVSYGTNRLDQVQIEDAALDAWLLLSYVTGLGRAQYFLREKEEMNPEQEAQYMRYIEMRSSHIPLQHITGTQEFMGLEFQVNEHVLIPRQDTECLVEEAEKELHSDLKILDMCTGSGCIIISLAKWAQRNRMQNISCCAADLSEAALLVAKENARNLKAEVTFWQSDLFENVDGKFGMIVSNPPYIRTQVIEELQEEVKLHDPFMALDGREDGLYFYRKIIDEARVHLETHGILMFEIGHDQGTDVSQLMKEAGYEAISVKKDLAGLDRIVTGVYNKE